MGQARGRGLCSAAWRPPRRLGYAAPLDLNLRVYEPADAVWAMRCDTTGPGGELTPGRGTVARAGCEDSAIVSTSRGQGQHSRGSCDDAPSRHGPELGSRDPYRPACARAFMG